MVGQTSGKIELHLRVMDTNGTASAQTEVDLRDTLTKLSKLEKAVIEKSQLDGLSQLLSHIKVRFLSFFLFFFFQF